MEALLEQILTLSRDTPKWHVPTIWKPAQKPVESSFYVQGSRLCCILSNIGTSVGYWREFHGAKSAGSPKRPPVSSTVRTSSPNIFGFLFAHLPRRAPKVAVNSAAAHRRHASLDL